MILMQGSLSCQVQLVADIKQINYNRVCFFGLHLPLFLELLIVMIQYNVVSLQVFSFIPHMFI